MVGKQELEETMSDGDMRKSRAKKKNLVGALPICKKGAHQASVYGQQLTLSCVHTRSVTNLSTAFMQRDHFF